MNTCRAFVGAPTRDRHEMRSQKDLDLSQWEFKSGETKVLPPFGVVYWYVDVKSPRSTGISRGTSA
jgi:hypothetical protein